MREVYSSQLALVVGILVVMVNAIFALIQSPEIHSSPEKVYIPVPHSVEGRGKCDACHDLKGDRPYPLRHLGWDNRSCLQCHLPVLKSTVVPLPDAPGDLPDRTLRNPHAERDWEDCIACHAVDKGVRPAPVNHKEWTNDMCSGCHPQKVESPQGGMGSYGRYALTERHKV